MFPVLKTKNLSINIKSENKIQSRPPPPHYLNALIVTRRKRTRVGSDLRRRIQERDVN